MIKLRGYNFLLIVKIITQEELFNHPGWLASKRLGCIANMHHIFLQNYLILKELLVKIYNDESFSAQTYQEFDLHMQQYLFNFLSASAALTDNCRKMMSFYKGAGIFDEYNAKIDEIFKKSLLSAFIKDLRNYQTHYKIDIPTPVRSLKDHKSIDIIFISDELLKENYQWTASSKKFMETCGLEISILPIINEYNDMINLFYSWLYHRIKQYHRNDFIALKQVICEQGSDEFNFEVMIDRFLT